ncbi:MAG TPA: tripartite tricarboxylate transporter substrate-binding protein [Pseudolabrys sp.]|nr:tripartite tricarboxylate transporter substrate-binding protein [Pseudolabrys sp.]
MKKTLVSALAGLLALAGSAAAQNYPTRPLTMVIPFAAGGPTDVLGRVIAQRMGEVLGQTVVVENVGGAGGMTGGIRVKNAAPDGYTMEVGTVGTHAQNQTLYKHPAYDSAKDFTPVALIAEVPIVLITRPDMPAKNLKEFVAYTKANQAKMQFGSAGAGSATHLGCVVANMAMGTNVTHVPYKGSAPAMGDLMAGRIDFFCEVASTAKALIDGGKVKAIALMAKTRSPALPNVPTGLEQGVPNFDAYTWNAIFMPKGVPADIVKKVNAAAVEAMNTPSVKERLQSLGATIVPPEQRTPEYLASYVKSEIVKWAAPIKASGVSVQ